MTMQGTLAFPFGEAEDSFALPVIDGHYLDAVYEDWKPARPTKVFATYWYFAAARQEVFFRKLCGEPSPWTLDSVLAKYRFTNAYRASDRVSQFLIRHVLYPDDAPNWSDEDLFFRTLLFKIFNKIETWQLLEKETGVIAWKSYSFDDYDTVLTRALESKTPIFSAAYIMPSGRSTFGSPRKHRNYLRLLERMMDDDLPRHIRQAKTLREVFHRLRDYPSLGDFLAFQFAIDLNYSPLLQFEERTFVVAGPGARDGVQKCFAETGGLNEEEIISLMAEHQEREFARLNLRFRSLWGRPLQLIDCQNLFCETDKYARVAHPEVTGTSGRTRIKQGYRPPNRIHDQVGSAWYPPKWGLNDAVRRTIETASGTAGFVPK